MNQNTSYKKRSPKKCKHVFSQPDVTTCSKCGLVKDLTKIDYTLEQYFEEKKRAETIIKTLEKIQSVMEKFEQKIILDDWEIKRLKKRVESLEKRK